MRKWMDASAVCINDLEQRLMVSKGKPNEEKTGRFHQAEYNETFENCCNREVEEETGYKVEVLKKYL